MNYWRMQLHPNEAESAAYYASESLVAGFIGLDFATDVGDLLAEEDHNILDTQKDYVAFAKEMAKGRNQLSSPRRIARFQAMLNASKPQCKPLPGWIA